MHKCYKCASPYTEPEKPGFQDACAKCESYLHCCMNCRFYDENAPNHCNEPQAEYVSDTHGFNHCEYFEFRRVHTSLVEDPEDPEVQRKRRRPDWRNLEGKKGERPLRGKRRVRARNPFGDDEGRPRRKNPFGDSSQGGSRKQRAREALDKLFEKSDE